MEERSTTIDVHTMENVLAEEDGALALVVSTDVGETGEGATGATSSQFVVQPR